MALPAFPPELVDTRSTLPVADPTIPGAGVAAADVIADGAASGAGEPAGPVQESDPGPAGSAVTGEADAVLVAVDAAGSPAAVAEPAGVEPVVVEPEPVAAEPLTARASDPPRPEPARPRMSPAEAAAEQAAADVALLRTFGAAPPAGTDDEPCTVSLEGACCAAAAPDAVEGAAQPVAFRVVGRDGAGVPGAGVTLLDDHGKEAAGAVADAGGQGTVLAPRPGGYVLVSAAAGHQPGAVAITVSAEPVSADLLLARSASLRGIVHGEDGPVVGARLTLVQDGEIVDTARSGPGGEYRIADLAAGEYGLSVTAAECEPAAVVVVVPEETDLQHDIELDPVGLKRSADDMMIGLS